MPMLYARAAKYSLSKGCFFFHFSPHGPTWSITLWYCDIKVDISVSAVHCYCTKTTIHHEKLLLYQLKSWHTTFTTTRTLVDVYTYQQRRCIHSPQSDWGKERIQVVHIICFQISTYPVFHVAKKTNTTEYLSKLRAWLCMPALCCIWVLNGRPYWCWIKTSRTALVTIRCTQVDFLGTLIVTSCFEFL
jgi:hypothetical protein